MFAKSDNLELKHLLLKFVFKEMILTEGELTYELNFPFSEFEKAYFYEKRSKFLQGSQNEENRFYVKGRGKSSTQDYKKDYNQFTTNLFWRTAYACGYDTNKQCKHQDKRSE